MKTIEVEITQEDLDHGTRMSCGECPLALGINRLLPDGRGLQARVYRNAFSVWPADSSSTLACGPLSLQAQSFVKFFDGGVKLTPQTVKIHVNYDPENWFQEATE